MPRNVRNFWISLNVDGKKHEVATGPRRKDGGFDINIKLREHGHISDTELNIEGWVCGINKDQIKLEIWEENPNKENSVIYSNIFKRDVDKS